MSLWKVPDDETRELMEHLYKELAVAAPADALRSAQLHLLKKLRADGDTNPVLWGAFIASGEQ